jgi:hypothetical protein
LGEFSGEDTMDQSITTIIASVIAVAGTLGGAITGVLLSNNHTSKMGKLRIEQEKAKRNTAVIEEVYTLLNKVGKHVYDKVSKWQEPDWQTDDMDRVRTLIYLYLPSMKQEFDEFSESIVYLAFATGTTQNTEAEKNERYEKLQYYRKCLEGLRASLEKMVR